MAEDILNKETAVQRMHKRMLRRRATALDKRINIVLVISFAILALLIGSSAWVIISYTIPLALPETVSVEPLVVSDREQVQATDFVQGLEKTGISVRFDGYSEERLGWQEITLTFTRGRESCSRKTKLYRFQLNPSLTVELGQEGSVSARDFVPDEEIGAMLMTNLKEGVSGKFSLELFCNGKDYTVECIVTEDVPPQGTGKELTVEAGTRPEAEAFVEGITDHSQVTVTYKNTPEFIILGEYPVTIVLTDYFGNATEVQSTAKVVPAENGPYFTGLEPLYLQVGTAVSYKTGVQAMDAQDGELTFTVDADGLDLKTVGRYTVFYSAVDADGNRVIAPRTVVVESQVGQLLREKAEKVLKEIINPNMTRDEKIMAVFNRAKYYVTYTGNSDKSSIENAAYEGFTKNAGDCYTYYAMVKVMLDMLEIPNLECRRIGGTSNHWWNLVEFEDGKYYHVDASPHPGTWMLHFKMTESTITDYTNHPDVANRRPNYYVYDHTLPEYQDIEIAQ